MTKRHHFGKVTQASGGQSGPPRESRKQDPLALTEAVRKNRRIR